MDGGSPMTLRSDVERYIAFKRGQGYKMRSEERLLCRYVSCAEAHGDIFVVAGRMVEWAGTAPSPSTVRSRLSAARCFARWVRAEDQRHEVPPNDVGPRAEDPAGTPGELGMQFGTPFVYALRHTMQLPMEATGGFAPLGVAEAKGHFSQMLDRVLNGECQLVRRRSEDPVLMTSIAHLAAFVERAPTQRFADLIAYDPALPVGEPLVLSEGARGTDEIEI